MKDAIRTYTGRLVRPLAMRPEDLDIVDIAHALSQVNRYTGHTIVPISVAEHSVRVAEICSAKNQLWGLLHDASEAYLCDVSRPVKHTKAMWYYRVAEEKLMRVIAARYGLSWPMPKEVHRADMCVGNTEMRDLMNGARYRKPLLAEVIEPWPAKMAEVIFLARFDALTKRTEVVVRKSNEGETHEAIDCGVGSDGVYGAIGAGAGGNGVQ